MPKLIKLACLAFALFAQYSCSLGRDQITFRVKVSDIRRAANSLIQNKSPDDSVAITLPGKLLNPSQPIPLIARPQADWSTPDRAAASVISANISGDIPWIIENYVPADRDAIAKQFSDPQAAQHNREYYRNLGKISETGWTEIRGFTVLFLRGVDEDGDATVISITLSKTPAGWKQTTALQTDDTFELVWTALHTGGAR